MNVTGSPRDRLCILVGILVGLAMFAHAAAVRAQTLEEALVMAYETNPELQAQRANLRVVNERIAQANGAWRPVVTTLFNASGAYTHNELRDVTTKIKNRSYPANASLSVDQTLYDGGRREARHKIAINDIQAERARVQAQEQEVLLTASVAYVDVIQHESVLNLRVNNLARLEKQLQATRDRFAVGEVTRTDVAQAESRVARARADKTQAEGDLVSSRMIFERVVGVRPGALTQPAMPRDRLPASQEEAVEAALAGNFSLITARFQERSASERIADSEAELMPSASVSASLSRNQNANGASNNSLNSARVKFEVRVPVYRGGIYSSRVRATKEDANRRRIVVEIVRRSVIENTARAFERLTTAMARTESLVSEEESARIALEGVEQEATVGARTVLDVLDAEQSLLDAQVRRVQAERAAFVAGQNVLLAMGRLTASEIGLPVKVYDMDRHFMSVRDRLYGTDPSPD